MCIYVFLVIVHILLLQTFGLTEGKQIEINERSVIGIHGKINIRSPTVWVRDLNFDECLDECKFRPSCTAVNYHSIFNLCELDLEPSPEIASIKARGVSYWIKSTQEDSVKCGIHSCKPGYACILQKNTCEIKECSPLSISNTTVIHGNVNAIGGKLKMRCKEGFTAKGPATITLTCGTDGVWSQEPFFCFSVTLKIGVNGQYTLTFAEAAGRCTDYGLTIATPAQLMEAWRQGMEMCSCGWLSDGSSGIILQSESPSCTRHPYNDGIMTGPCAYRTKQNVWCSI